MIRRRIADLAPSTSCATPRRPARTWPFSIWSAAQGVLVDTVSAGEIRRALAAGYSPEGDPPPIVYTADIFDAEALDLCVERNIHVNCGSPDMIDQFGARAPGREHHAADQSRLRPRPQPEDQHRRQAGEARHLAHADRRVPRPRRPPSPVASPACTCTSARAPIWSTFRRSAARWSRRRPKSGPSLRSISVGGGLPTVYRPTDAYVDLAAYFALCDATRKRLEERFGHAVRLEIEPGRYLVAESGYLVAEIRADQAAGRQHVLPARRRLQQSRPADPLRRVSSDVDRAGRRRHRSGRSTR